MRKTRKVEKKLTKEDFEEFQRRNLKSREKNVTIFNTFFTIFGIILVLYGIYTLFHK